MHKIKSLNSQKILCPQPRIKIWQLSKNRNHRNLKFKILHLEWSPISIWWIFIKIKSTACNNYISSRINKWCSCNSKLRCISNSSSRSHLKKLTQNQICLCLWLRQPNLLCQEDKVKFLTKRSKSNLNRLWLCLNNLQGKILKARDQGSKTTKLQHITRSMILIKLRRIKELSTLVDMTFKLKMKKNSRSLEESLDPRDLIWKELSRNAAKASTVV